MLTNLEIYTELRYLLQRGVEDECTQSVMYSFAAALVSDRVASLSEVTSQWSRNELNKAADDLLSGQETGG